MTEAQRFRSAIRRLHRLIRLKAPPVIKAHYLIKVLVPYMIENMNIVEESSTQLASLLSRGMAFHVGYCTVCLKAPATTEYHLCPKCQAECDQLEAEVDNLVDRFDTHEYEEDI